MMKRCSKCGELKELLQFNKRASAKDGRRSDCRKCDGEASIKYIRKIKGRLPMSKNKDCSLYIGVAVAERLVRHLFKDVQRMPNGHPGYDFICAKDKKIDVKSACFTINNGKNPYWSFHIGKNKIADYFLLLAFNNRAALEPQHQWIIPGEVLNHLVVASISPSTIDKWDAYRQPIDAAQICCNNIKSASE